MNDKGRNKADGTATICMTVHLPDGPDQLNIKVFQNPGMRGEVNLACIRASGPSLLKKENHSQACTGCTVHSCQKQIPHHRQPYARCFLCVQMTLSCKVHSVDRC